MGNGEMKETVFEDILPVEIQGPFDLIQLEPAAQVVSVKSPEKKYGYCRWIHRVKVKDGAQVVMKAGRHPF